MTSSLSFESLLRARPNELSEATRPGSKGGLWFPVLVLVLGAGLYGGAMGLWRSPLQAVYVAIKFPLIVLLTCGGNALINAMLAPLLGLNISLRQSLAANIASFGIAGAIMGGFAPVLLFLLWNVPRLSPGVVISRDVYAAILLTNVVLIAIAGITANLKLLKLLQHWSNRKTVAIRVLLVWLAGNLFLGSQLSWILRPFVGSPNLPVEFLRATAFKGNFYETVFRSIVNLTQS